MSTQQRSREQRKALLRAIEPYDAVQFWLPGDEEPADLDQALRWIDHSSEAGLDIDFRIEPDEEGAAVWLLHWSAEAREADVPGYVPARQGQR